MYLGPDGGRGRLRRGDHPDATRTTSTAVSSTSSTLRTDVGAAAITILTGLLMLVGTTYAGHDWNTGSMSNQLLFEPRRLRLWAAKGVAVLLTGAVVGAAVLALFWAGAAILASSRDVTAAPGLWRDILGDPGPRRPRHRRGRPAGLRAHDALPEHGGDAVADVRCRDRGIAAASWPILGDAAARWLLPTNFLAFVLGGFAYYDASACTYSRRRHGVRRLRADAPAVDGGLVLAVVVVVAVALSLWATQRATCPEGAPAGLPCRGVVPAAGALLGLSDESALRAT